MTTDLFERRLRRDLDVIADALAADEDHIPMALHPRPKAGRPRKIKTIAAAVAAVVAVAGGAAVAGGPDETLTAGSVSPGCPVVAAQPAQGTDYVVGSGEADGTEWTVETSGTASAPDMSMRSFVGATESTGIVADAASWPAVVNQGVMGWMYDTNPATFTVAYGMLPPEAEAVRITVDGDVSEVCAATVPGETLRYFATTFTGQLAAITAIDASGHTLMTDTPVDRLDRSGALGTSVKVNAPVSLPIGGVSAAEPDASEPPDVLVDGQTAGVDWELRVGATDMFLMPFGGMSGMEDARDGVYSWEAVRRGDGWWLWGDAPTDTAAVHLRFADGHSERGTAHVHPDVLGRSFFAVAAEGHDAPDQVVLVRKDGTVATVAIDDRIPSEPAGRTSYGFDVTLPSR